MGYITICERHANETKEGLLAASYLRLSQGVQLMIPRVSLTPTLGLFDNWTLDCLLLPLHVGAGLPRAL